MTRFSHCSSCGAYVLVRDKRNGNGKKITIFPPKSRIKVFKSPIIILGFSDRICLNCGELGKTEIIPNHEIGPTMGPLIKAVKKLEKEKR